MNYSTNGHYTPYGTAPQNFYPPPPPQPYFHAPPSHHLVNYSRGENSRGFRHHHLHRHHPSNGRGRKKALLVGINYFGTPNQLRGCINDVRNMSGFLHHKFGYSYNDMVILTDDQHQVSRLPLKQNIIRAMQWLVRDAGPNDSLVFHYSGHGGKTKDIDGDEDSGYDEVIYPLDFKINGFIVDDLMHDIMVRHLPPGCRLTALFDSCHSGTALDLPYVYSTKGLIKQPNLLKDAGSSALSALKNCDSGNISGALDNLGGIVRRVANLGKSNRQQVVANKSSPANVVSLSGCKDDQTSADAVEGGQRTGAMSWAFMKTLSELPNQTYLTLLNNMRILLSARYSQKPQLSSSHPQDMNKVFLM